MITIFCKTPSDQSQVLSLLDPTLTPINRSNMIIIKDGDRTSFTHLSDCDGYQYTAKQWIKEHKIN